MGSKEDEIFRIVEEKNVRFVRLQFVDVQGIPKNVAIPVGQLEKALGPGIHFDGSSIEGFVRIEESDMVLRPDPDTFRVLPWSGNEGTAEARLICDIELPDGKPFMGCPRQVLKKNMEEAAKLGYVMNTGPEMEFFLFKRQDGMPTNIPQDRGGYFDLAPIDLAEEIKREIVLVLEEMGFEVEAAHHEVAFGQHEIDFKYDNALATADNVITLKYVAKTLALQHGLHATFMPKPIFGVNGSGMHTNTSLFKDGKNAFYDPDAPDQISDTLRYFVGGVLKHIRAITAITNPLVNSYKRLVPGYEAPVYITWSGPNRSSLIRVPAPRGNSTRIEIRSPDPSCNPYLAFAAILAAGLDGVKNKIEPPERVEKNIYKLTEEEREKLGIGMLPGTLKEAIECFKEDELLVSALGEHVSQSIINVAMADWDSYRTQVHQWELDRYLQTY
ncbi:type I glutamate--ammonia ligase [Methermicoccus shengliensis]|uniref:Glutamine synthetase n=1 Tax=Methermicoccus shengliensis TaxID=660064 RepID=A0A832VZP6_9EURY|nr:type I glutamate--ammonia ligase [Methermicoccus shengliensis]8OOW_A Chain A, Glutamine synthetase [Methermicoccus shengliensis DSM 18856]8OOW_B Chain B, Glutamine synthetase [Methermicoccus shengliensis DSM 18856]8OOW_C Chain C, Glutamine synthetase [Methermicoccus shengliensis DSM 18856]8OOW_D Chain D, Glutamine synthetase [Methermicoccus shengliensis DSM 18856]8OOW_E Chain E, Glutamine synthetase [Methermicoccus shengliensis DSM 18856]8OOW_F Chain F, Glutamine synthetase [Methermicoccus